MYIWYVYKYGGVILSRPEVLPLVLGRKVQDNILEKLQNNTKG